MLLAIDSTHSLQHNPQEQEQVYNNYSSLILYSKRTHFVITTEFVKVYFMNNLLNGFLQNVNFYTIPLNVVRQAFAISSNSLRTYVNLLIF